MDMINCIKMLMELNRVEQSRLARWRNVSANTVSVMFKAKDMKCGTACEILDFMGYELIVREKSPTNRRKDEILIDYSKDDIDPHKILVLKAEEEAAKEKEAYYSEKDRELDRDYPWGMSLKDLKYYFHRNGDLIHKYFDGYFRGKRVPVKYVKEIMRKYDL